MSLQNILIVAPEMDQADQVTERIDTLVRYLSQDGLIGCYRFKTLDDARHNIDRLLPDLIFLLSDSLEEHGENLQSFLYEIRRQSTHFQRDYRIVVVIEGGETGKEKRIEYLVAGADDILSSQLTVDELSVRILAHLRRNLELLTHPVTHLPGFAIASRLLQRQINRNDMSGAPKENNPEQENNSELESDGKPWAFMLCEIDYFDVYQEVYGELPANQVLRTVAAILMKLAIPPDFAGHFDETDTFWLLTEPDRAEKIASILCRQFEAACPNFYSEKDRKRGYVISVVDPKMSHRASRRVPLLTLSIGIINNQTQPYLSYKAAFSAATEMKFLAKRFPGNAWVSDRLKLTGDCGQALPQAPHILLVESDAALAYLLKTILEMEHYQVTWTSSVQEAMATVSSQEIQLVILDALIQEQPVGWDLCRDIKAQSPKTQAVLISTLHDRERALDAGADLYLPKPFEVIYLFAWIERLLRQQGKA